MRREPLSPPGVPPGGAASGGPSTDRPSAPRTPAARRSGGGGERLLLIGDLARATGKTVRAIHHYEELGLLRPHARSKGRYRLYDADAVLRTRWITKLGELGLSLAQIQAIVRAVEAAPSATNAMARVKTVYVKKLDETRAQIERLRSLERELVESLHYLDTCHTCEPVRLLDACPRCDLHEETERQPELLAGLHAS